MKLFTHSTILLISMLLVASCSGEKEQASEQDDPKNDPVETVEVDELEHEINEPFLFPFGLEIKGLDPTGYRTACGGDCCSGVKVLEKGEYAIFLDTSDCWEYGYHEKYLLYRGDELIACHEKSFSMGKLHSSFNMRNRIERTIDFENERYFIRTDTLKNSQEKWINKPFETAIYSSGLKGEVQKFVDDPREHRNIESDKDFTIHHNQIEGKATPVVFFNPFQPDYDIEIINAYALQEVSDNEARGIPKDAVFAYSTWYAGGGDLIYGAVNDGVLQVWYSYEDEMLEEIPPYELLLDIDLDVTLFRPDHYILFNPAKGGKNKLMIALDKEEKALYAKYEGQSRQIELRKKSDRMEGKKIISEYEEIILGIPNGTYTHTHDGNWDYVTYKGKNGKKVKFTINHELSAPNNGDGYRDKPLF
ncbi:hypothetical protein N9355_03315 [Crocinitomicaceae bacterium]|nr:hypothetical protein [Crocinitomicaceae bacterium]